VTVTAIADPTSLEGCEIYFDAALPGFPGVHRFQLSPWGDKDGPFRLMVSLDAPELAFVVVEPEPFFPDFAVEIDRATADRLGLANPDEAVVHLIVTLGRSPVEATVNLLGPVVVNRRNLLAAQVVLDGPSDRLRTPLIGPKAF